MLLALKWFYVSGVRRGSHGASVRLGPTVFIYLQVPFKRQWPEGPSPLGQVAIVDSGMTGILALVVLAGFLSFFGWGCSWLA